MRDLLCDDSLCAVRSPFSSDKIASTFMLPVAEYEHRFMRGDSEACAFSNTIHHSRRLPQGQHILPILILCIEKGSIKSQKHDLIVDDKRMYFS